MSNEERRRPLIACQFSSCHTSQIRDSRNEKSSSGSRMHTSPAICRAGRVPSREAFRGSVITCLRNNERLILSSWLVTPPLSPSSLSLFLSFVLVESARSVATYRPFVVPLSQSFYEHESFDCSTFCTVFTYYAPLYISPACLDEHSVVFRGRRYRFILYAVRFRVRFNRSRRYGSARRTGETWEVALPKCSI